MRRVWLGAVGTLAAVCMGCAGLPAKQKPAPLPGAVPLDGFEAAGGGDWPAADWWKRYQDPTLDRLIELALNTSPTLATAHARYDSARQSVRIAGAASGVRVDADADIDRQRLSDNGLFPPKLLGFNWYNLSDLGSAGELHLRLVGASSMTRCRPRWTRPTRPRPTAAPPR